MKIEIEKDKLERLLKLLDVLDTCLVEAPVDFLGTASNWKQAEKESIEWEKSWKNAMNESENIITDILKEYN